MDYKWDELIEKNSNYSLILACIEGDLDKIKKSIRNGSMSMNIGTHYCILNNKQECIKYLLSIGSNLQNKRTIYKLIEEDNLEMLKILREYRQIENKYFSIQILLNDFYSYAVLKKATKIIKYFEKTEKVTKINLDLDLSNKKIYKDTSKNKIIEYVIKNQLEKLHTLLNINDSMEINKKVEEIILDPEINFNIKEYLKCYWF
tara:strand:+ start:175 stop:783 length:609 start_codon:yes stop_codon:yes gene_type:complete